MATEFYFDLDGRRMPFRQPEVLPRVGETILLTPFGRVRATRHLVQRVEWAIAQEESPAYFNRPKFVVVYLEPEPSATAES